MAEYSKERLYFLKLPSDFFAGHKIRILESMPNGVRYESMLLKLMCESISHGGYLRFSEGKPYTPEMIAAITGIDKKSAREGLEALKSLELIEDTEEGSIFIPCVPKMVSSTTEGADRKRTSRGQKGDKQGTKGGQMSTECPPEYRY